MRYAVVADSHEYDDKLHAFYDKAHRPLAVYPVCRTLVESVEYDVDARGKAAATMSWKDVFNTDLKPSGWGDITNAAKAAHDSGYKYFNWNGWVYETNCSRYFVEGSSKELKEADLV